MCANTVTGHVPVGAHADGWMGGGSLPQRDEARTDGRANAPSVVGWRDGSSLVSTSLLPLTVRPCLRTGQLPPCDRALWLIVPLV